MRIYAILRQDTSTLTLTSATLTAKRKSRKTFPASTVGKYLKDIGQVPLLTHEQEITLGKKVQRFTELLDTKEELANSLPGEPTVNEWAEQADVSPEALQHSIQMGKRARARMVAANLRLVVSVAKKYSGSPLDFMDLIQEGNIGLHRAVEKFDPTKGYRFSTYAYWWIRQAITRAIAQTSRTVRLPVHIHERLSKLRKARRKLSQELSRPATLSEISEELDVSVSKVRQLQKLQKTALSLNMRIGEDQNTELGDLIESDKDSPEDYATHSLLQQDLDNLLDSLSDRQQEIIRLRFGLESGKRMTLAQIGNRLDISRERVRQIERKAMRLLRRNGRGLKEYISVG